jgi:hypothetical protein
LRKVFYLTDNSVRLSRQARILHAGLARVPLDLDRLFRLADDVGQRAIRTPLWISGVGCGILASKSTRRYNEIDDAVLPKLTEDHLRELGFSLGARLKLLDAIACTRVVRFDCFDLSQVAANRIHQPDHLRDCGNWRGASPSHGYVLGPRGLDSALHAYGS